MEMRYIRGTQDYKLEGLQSVKVRLVDNEDYVETPWAAQSPDLKECILQNQALAFYPYPSWGAVIPNRTFNFVDSLEKGELTLHPEAFDYYLEQKWIDADGNSLEKMK